MKKESKEVKIEEDDWIVLDPKTGNIIGTYGADDKIVHNEDKKNEYIKNHIVDFNKGVGFVKLYNGVAGVLREELTPTEFIVAISLVDYISYDNCIIRFHKNILTMNDLANELNMKYQTIRRVIPSLVRKGVIGSFRTGNINDCKTISKCYLVNPYIYFRGMDLSKSVYDLFIHTGWKERLEHIEEKYKIIGGNKE